MFIRRIRLDLTRGLASLVMFANLLFFCSTYAQAGQVALAWDASTSSGVAGYQLGYGQTRGSYATQVDVGNQLNYTLTGLNDGATYYFAAKAYDSGKATFSAFSNEVSATTPLSPLPPAVCPCSLWGSASTPAIASASDSNAVELGIKFRADVAGYVTALRFYKGSGNTGPHVGNLWTSAGTLLASVSFTNESASGWQQVNLPAPVAVTANTVYVASYHTTLGRYAYNSAYFTGEYAKSPLRAPASGVSGGNGVYKYGASGFPNQTNNANNYWVDVVFHTTVSPPPTAGFVANPTSGTAPLTVTFADDSSGNIDTWSWNFGDGTTSTGTARNAAKAYANSGTYPVVLTVTGPGGSTTATRTISVTAAAPVADFTATPVSGIAPLAVAFTDGSTGTASGYSWSFGDGGTSTVQHPAHTYTAAGTYTVSLMATGPGGTSPPKTRSGYITVSSSGGGSNTGRVGAYNFEEASGTTVVDASGKANTGTISGATRTTQGRFGKALSFDGVNDWVTINDSASLDLTSGMTLEAWVYPTVNMSQWATVVLKEQPGGGLYELYANGDQSQPLTSVTVGGRSKVLSGGPWLLANQWTHLAATYDGTTQRLYVNGIQLAQRPQTGPIQVSSSPLRLGGNSVWGEFFKGRIDEVRVYNRALSSAEINADLNAAIVCPCSLWGSTTMPAIVSWSDSNAQELGVKFRAEVNGVITGLRFYKGAQNTGPHVGNLWTSTGTKLASVTFSNETASGWQQVSLPTPVAITANTTYVASYHTTVGRYAANSAYFTGEYVKSPLRAPANGVSGGNGVYKVGASGFPNQTYNANNYWVDVVFDTMSAPQQMIP